LVWLSCDGNSELEGIQPHLVLWVVIFVNSTGT
jgi:hypothetical protein